MAGLPDNLRVLSELPNHSGYSIEDRRTMDALGSAEERHFWHLTRNRFIADRLRRLDLPPPARLLELGCGGGAVSAHLAREGWEVLGVEGHLPRALQAAARAPTARFVVLDLERDLAGLEEDSFDAVGLFDVLEHLDDPLAALTRALSRVRSGGLVVGTVPAMMALWSEADRESGHRQRFERAGLRALLDAVPSAETVEVVAFNRLLVPMLWMQRRLASRDALVQGLEVPWSPLNQILIWMLSAEHRLEGALDVLRLPGASLWFALQRA